jgi:hypothetical protein
VPLQSIENKTSYSTCCQVSIALVTLARLSKFSSHEQALYWLSATPVTFARLRGDTSGL